MCSVQRQTHIIVGLRIPELDTFPVDAFAFDGANLVLPGEMRI